MGPCSTHHWVHILLYLAAGDKPHPFTLLQTSSITTSLENKENILSGARSPAATLNHWLLTG